ncbi:MAG: endonuclease III [Bacilli bacterium]
MKKQKIIDYLDYLIPNPNCELTYRKDYELLIKVMLSAQTTDKQVNKVGDALFTMYPSLELLNGLDQESLEKILKPIGTYHKKAFNVKIIVSELITKYNNVVPNNRAILESLPGVGRKTANVVLSNLFNESCIAVDTHVARVSKRLNLVDDQDNPLIIEQKLTKYFENDLGKRHHQLVLFGRYYCKASNPQCYECGLKNICKKKKLDYNTYKGHTK